MDCFFFHRTPKRKKKQQHEIVDMFRTFYYVILISLHRNEIFDIRPCKQFQIVQQYNTKKKLNIPNVNTEFYYVFPTGY